MKGNTNVGLVFDENMAKHSNIVGIVILWVMWILIMQVIQTKDINLVIFSLSVVLSFVRK